MSHYLLELKLQSISFEAEELHIILPTKTRIFILPFYSVSIDIPSSTSSLIFEFHVKSQIIFRDKLNPSLPKARFSDTEHKTVEFIAEVHQLLKPEFKKSKDSLIELQEKVKRLQNSNKTFSDFQDFDFFSMFQSSFDDLSSEQYSKYLESVVQGLSQKVKYYELHIKSLKNNENFGNSYKNLDSRNSNEFLKSSGKVVENQELQKQTEGFNKEKLELNQKIRTKTVEEEKLASENNSLKGEVLKIKSDTRNFEGMEKNIKILKNTNTDEETAMEELKKQFKNYRNEQQELVKLYESNFKELTEENQRLLKEVNQAHEKIKVLEESRKKLLNDNYQLQLEVTRETTCLKKIEKLFQIETKETPSSLVNDLLQQISNLKALNSELTLTFTQESKKLINKCKELEIISISTKKAELRRANNNSKSSFSELFESSTAISKPLFEKLLQDLKFSFSTLKEIDFKSIYENTSLYEHSEQLSQKLLTYSKTIFNLQKTITNLVEAMRELKSENFALRERLFFAQNVLPLYIPVRGDPLDFAMAEFINNLKRPLKIPFVRQDPGFYLFGSRNIKIRLVNNKPFIYAPEPGMTIEEFLSKFTKVEILRFEEYRKAEEQRTNTEASRFGLNESVFSTSPLTPALSLSKYSPSRSGSNPSIESPEKNVAGSTKVSHSKKSSLPSLSRIFRKP